MFKLSCVVGAVLVAAIMSGEARAACSVAPRSISYATNSFEVDSASMAAIIEIARSVRVCGDDYKIQVNGYSSKGEEPRLAIIRAKYVRDLLSKAGVPDASLSSYGHQGNSEAAGQVTTIEVVAVERNDSVGTASASSLPTKQIPEVASV